MSSQLIFDCWFWFCLFFPWITREQHDNQSPEVASSTNVSTQPKDNDVGDLNENKVSSPLVSTSTRDSNNITTELQSSPTRPNLPNLPLIGTLPLELRIKIYIPNLSMTINGDLPAIFFALNGTIDYAILCREYKCANFVLTNATLPTYLRMSQGGRFKKILFLNIRSDSLLLKSMTVRDPLRAHITKLINYFYTINFTAILPPASDYGTHFDETGLNISVILSTICHMMIASRRPAGERRLRIKFLGYKGEELCANEIESYVYSVEKALSMAGPGRRWGARRRELVGDGGVVHDGIVWVWDDL